MYSNNYTKVWSNLANTQIERPEQIRALQQNIYHPSEPVPHYEVKPQYATDDAPTMFRDVAVREALGTKRYDYQFNTFEPDPTPEMKIYDSDQLFQPIADDASPITNDALYQLTNLEAANAPNFDPLANLSFYPPYLQHKGVLNQEMDEMLSYETISTSNKQADNTIKEVRKKGLNMEGVIRGPHRPFDNSVTKVDALISSPDVDYNVFKPVNERFGITSSITTSNNITDLEIDGNKMISSPTLAVSNLNLNKTVPIKYENYAPSSASLSSAEAFRTSMTGYFRPEAFAPDMGVYDPNSSQDSMYGISRPVESFEYANKSQELMAPQAIESYMTTLKARATAVCFYLQNNKSYSKWANNWLLLYNNLHTKNKLLFERLDESDADVAYVVNKGDEVKFRIRDEKRFIPINIYQYVLYHEMAHMSTTELQHTKGFFRLLAIIALGAMEMGFIDLSRMSSSYYKTNGMPVLCRASMKTELMQGCDLLAEANPGSREYFMGLKEYINRK